MWLCLLAVAACNSSAPSGVAPVANPGQPSAEAALRAYLETVPADDRDEILSAIVRQLLETEHLLQRPINDEISAQAFPEYIERLDPAKLFLLDLQVQQLKVYATQFDDQLRSGDLALARIGNSLLTERQELVGAMVAQRLTTPFDFTLDETIETDPDKERYAATEQELTERWRKLLKLQVLQRIARMEARAQPHDDAAGGAIDAGIAEPPPPATFAEREQKAREDLAKSYAGRFSRLAKIEPLEPAEAFVNAITAVFDPHTIYLPPSDKENFDIQMSGSLEGIGAVLSEDDHYIIVREIVPGGASWRQGALKAGDLILAVTQDGKEAVDVVDMRIDQVVQMVRGPKGTKVVLTVKKPDGAIETIAITRDIVIIEAAYARGAILELGKGQQPVGYIELPSFYGNTRSQPGGTPERNSTGDVRALLAELSKQKVRGVIIDLRSNGGGLLDHSRDITGMFIATGPVVQTRSADGSEQVLGDSDPTINFGGEVVVLVDRFSASASEILAGALQDYQRAVIVGTSPTHGKGTVQVLVNLDRFNTRGGGSLGVLKLTIQQFFRIDGESTQWRGVVPDILLPDPVAHIESGERYLDNSIPWSQVKPLPFTVWPQASWNIAALAANSNQRVADNEVFTQIMARGALLKQRMEETTVPLAIETWRAKRDKDKLALEAVNPKLQEAKPTLRVRPVEYGAPPATGDEAAQARLDAWRDRTQSDPWLEESARILNDMIPKK